MTTKRQGETHRLRLLRRLLGLLMALASAGAVLGQNERLGPLPRKSSPGAYQLIVQDSDWGRASMPDLKRVLRSACDQLMKHFPERRLEPIRVRYSRHGPITLFQRSLRGEVIVELSSRDLFWSQYSFQMAHEFCHLLCDFKSGAKSNMWFEESICEVASLFALRSMARQWKTKAPYVSWRGYSSSLADYAQDRIQKQQLPPGTTFLEWFRTHEKSMREQPTLREKNGIVAVRLLPLFEDNPEHWPAVGYLNVGRTFREITLKEYLASWRRNAPEKHRSFILKVAGEFGI